MAVYKKIFIYIFIMLILSYIFGLHQNKIIKVDDIKVQRLIGYKFTSLPMYESPLDYSLVLYYLGLIGKFEIKDNSHILLNFQNIILNKEIHISFNTSKNEKKDFLMIHSQNHEKVSNRKKCLYSQESKIINNIKVYEVFGFIKNSDTSFYIVGNSKLDITEVFNGICPG